MVKLLVAAGEYGDASGVTAFVLKNQPTNVDPASVGADGRVSEPPVWKVRLATGLPPSESKVIVLVLALH